MLFRGWRRLLVLDVVFNVFVTFGAKNRKDWHSFYLVLIE